MDCGGKRGDESKVCAAHSDGRAVVRRLCEVVKNVPWHLYKDHQDADGDIPEEKSVENPTSARASGGIPKVVISTRRVPPRSFQIRKEDAEVRGYSRGCAGCSSWFRGLGRQPHTAECRARFAEILKDDAKYQNAEKKRVEFEDKIKEKEDRKRQRREEGGAEQRSRRRRTMT